MKYLIVFRNFIKFFKIVNIRLNKQLVGSIIKINYIIVIKNLVQIFLINMTHIIKYPLIILKYKLYIKVCIFHN